MVDRPKTIACARCDASVTVKSKGPVPSYCPDCRRARKSRKSPRPEFVSCERCGSDVSVRPRGPLPRFCRDGCQAPAVDAAQPVDMPAGPQTPAVQRPWDRAPNHRTARKPKPTAPRSPSEPIKPATATRIDTVYPAVGTADLSKAVRVNRFRHAVAVLGWIAVVLIIALIVFVGSRPAPIGV
jgi:hypothetical protein